MRQAQARALWYTAPGEAELRWEPLPAPGPGDVIIRSVYSGVSRGTERLVLSGGVPASERERMRCPLQAGEFPFPVKYGYAAVGIAEGGSPELSGQAVFVLHPHQDVFLAPRRMVFRVPDEVPAKRATLAANMETALNALWDSNAAPASRIAVVGAGTVGLLIAHLAARLPGADVTVIDTNETRRDIAEALGCRFAQAADAPSDCDSVFHTSATAAGLATAIGCAGFEAEIIELSWFGERVTSVSLGGAFHSRRLRLISSQVGHVAPILRPRWSHRRRMEAALGLLAASELDMLVAMDIPFEEAAERLPKLLQPDSPGLAPVIRYRERGGFGTAATE